MQILQAPPLSQPPRKKMLSQTTTRTIHFGTPPYPQQNHQQGPPANPGNYPPQPQDVTPINHPSSSSLAPFGGYTQGVYAQHNQIPQLAPAPDHPYNTTSPLPYLQSTTHYYGAPSQPNTTSYHPAQSPYASGYSAQNFSYLRPQPSFTTAGPYADHNINPQPWPQTALSAQEQAMLSVLNNNSGMQAPSYQPTVQPQMRLPNIQANFRQVPPEEGLPSIDLSGIIQERTFASGLGRTPPFHALNSQAPTLMNTNFSYYQQQRNPYATQLQPPQRDLNAPPQPVSIASRRGLISPAAQGPEQPRLLPGPGIIRGPVSPLRKELATVSIQPTSKNSAGSVIPETPQNTTSTQRKRASLTSAVIPTVANPDTQPKKRKGAQVPIANQQSSLPSMSSRSSKTSIVKYPPSGSVNTSPQRPSFFTPAPQTTTIIPQNEELPHHTSFAELGEPEASDTDGDMPTTSPAKIAKISGRKSLGKDHQNVQGDKKATPQENLAQFLRDQTPGSDTSDFNPAMDHNELGRMFSPSPDPQESFVTRTRNSFVTPTLNNDGVYTSSHFVVMPENLQIIYHELIMAVAENENTTDERKDEIKRILTSHPYMINTVNKDGLTPAMVAADGAEPEVFEFLLKQPGIDRNFQTKNGGYTIAHWIAPQQPYFHEKWDSIINDEHDLTTGQPQGRWNLLLKDDKGKTPFDYIQEAHQNISLNQSWHEYNHLLRPASLEKSAETWKKNSQDVLERLQTQMDVIGLLNKERDPNWKTPTKSVEETAKRKLRVR